MANKNPQLQFHSAKAVKAGVGFPAAVESSLEQFQAAVPRNLRHGQATVIAAVTVPEDGAYFAIVLAGPCKTLKDLQEALAQVSNGYLSKNLKRIGIE